MKPKKMNSVGWPKGKPRGDTIGVGKGGRQFSRATDLGKMMFHLKLTCAEVQGRTGINSRTLSAYLRDDPRTPIPHHHARLLADLLQCPEGILMANHRRDKSTRKDAPTVR